MVEETWTDYFPNCHDQGFGSGLILTGSGSGSGSNLSGQTGSGSGSGSRHLCLENFPSILWWVLIRNCCLFHFWRSLVIIFKFSSDKSLLETFLHSFFLFQNLGWNRIQRNLKPDPDPEKFEKLIRIMIRNPGCRCEMSDMRGEVGYRFSRILINKKLSRSQICPDQFLSIWGKNGSCFFFYIWQNVHIKDDFEW